MSRAFIVGGNWKMNGNKEQIKQIISNLKSSSLNKGTEVVLGVPAPYLEFVSSLVDDSPIQVAAQNCYKEASGAFTDNDKESAIDVTHNWSQYAPIMLKDLPNSALRLPNPRNDKLTGKAKSKDKWYVLAEEKLELVRLQRRILLEEHETKMLQEKGKHYLEMKLLYLQIKLKEKLQQSD